MPPFLDSIVAYSKKLRQESHELRETARIIVAESKEALARSRQRRAEITHKRPNPLAKATIMA
jgi:hypothetical protein